MRKNEKNTKTLRDDKEGKYLLKISKYKTDGLNIPWNSLCKNMEHE